VKGSIVQLRLLAVAIVAIVFALAQTIGSGASFIGDASAYAASLSPQRPATTVYQDDNADDEADDDDDDTDNTDDESDDADNADDDADDADNADDEADDGDNVDDADNADADADNDEDDDTADDTTDDGATAGTPSIDDDQLKQPLQQASGTSNGGDKTVATPGERVAIHMFSWMPAGVEVTIRPIDPNTVAAAPGTRAGDLVFAVEAKDASGTQLTALPAEVNLAVRYADDTVSGLNEGNLTLSRLDPATNQWQAAPKLVREPDSNYMAASVTQIGTYAVSAP
jgi:hypothetical protein